MSLIRNMRFADLDAINEIYNQAVESKFSTAHTEPISMDERLSWFSKHDPDLFPVFILEDKGMICGWISFSPYREGRKALQHTAEISYYVHSAHHRRGIGSRLLEYSISIAPSLSFKTLIAILLEPNTGSIALLEFFGFTRWGNMPRVAEIEGDMYNHLYYGLHLTLKIPGIT